jgi:hypothetical protein
MNLKAFDLDYNTLKNLGRDGLKTYCGKDFRDSQGRKEVRYVG